MTPKWVEDQLRIENRIRSVACADQSERDHNILMKAVRQGRMEAAMEADYMTGEFCRRVTRAQGPIPLRDGGLSDAIMAFACGRKTNASRSRREGRLALPLAAGCAALLFGILGLYARPAAAADSSPPQANAAQSSLGAALSPEQLSNAANNPNAPLTQLELRNVVAPALPGFSGTGNTVQLQAILPLKPSALIPFPMIMKLLVPVVTLPGPVDQTALGSTEFVAQAVFKQSWGSWGVGFSVVAPTDTFTGFVRPKWQVGPAAALIYTGISNLVFGGVFEDPIPIGSGSRQGQSSSLSFTPSMTYTLPDGWFAGYPDFNWSANLDSGGITFPVGLQVGKVFQIGRQPFSASLEAGYNVVRPANGTGVPRLLIGIEFTALFPAL